jgi:hypothetical protein
MLTVSVSTPVTSKKQLLAPWPHFAAKKCFGRCWAALLVTLAMRTTGETSNAWYGITLSLAAVGVWVSCWSSLDGGCTSAPKQPDDICCATLCVAVSAVCAALAAHASCGCQLWTSASALWRCCRERQQAALRASGVAVGGCMLLARALSTQL